MGSINAAHTQGGRMSKSKGHNNMVHPRAVSQKQRTRGRIRESKSSQGTFLRMSNQLSLPELAHKNSQNMELSLRGWATNELATITKEAFYTHNKENADLYAEPHFIGRRNGDMKQFNPRPRKA